MRGYSSLALNVTVLPENSATRVYSFMRLTNFTFVPTDKPAQLPHEVILGFFPLNNNGAVNVIELWSYCCYS